MIIIVKKCRKIGAVSRQRPRYHEGKQQPSESRRAHAKDKPRSPEKKHGSITAHKRQTKPPKDGVPSRERPPNRAPPASTPEAPSDAQPPTAPQQSKGPSRQEAVDSLLPPLRVGVGRHRTPLLLGPIENSCGRVENLFRRDTSRPDPISVGAVLHVRNLFRRIAPLLLRGPARLGGGLRSLGNISAVAGACCGVEDSLCGNLRPL
mmetsp:Transcript_23286/g.58848  ORF Transcript_23286/g.58848 Transcript_23286/m.58848 type:complete len:206 (+) Transcript_23286:173-790(+)